MSVTRSSSRRGRRTILTGLGAAATAAALGQRSVAAQSTTPFQPLLHSEDDWMELKGRHRIVIDVTSPEGVPDAIRFAGNLFNGNKSGYGVEESDVAILMCLRHSATAYAYGDGLWAKHGKALDAKAATPPTQNPFNTTERPQLTNLIKRGVHFMVCGTASRGIAGRLAGQGGDADAMLKDMVTHLLPNARLVSAGVVGVTHAQERGYSLLFVG